jgi:predicted amidophosphoribosyltransferase
MVCSICGDEIDPTEPHCELDVKPQNHPLEECKAYFCKECAAQAALSCPYGPLEYDDWANPGSETPNGPTRAHLD